MSSEIKSNKNIIFSGDYKKVKKQHIGGIIWFVGLPSLTFGVGLLLDYLGGENLLSAFITLLSDTTACLSLFIAFTGGSVIFFWTLILPQTLEIRTDGFAPPYTRLKDFFHRRKTFIKYNEIEEIVLGETPIEYEINLKDGSYVLPGLAMGYFLEVSVSANRIPQFDRIFRAVKQKLDEIKASGYKGEIILDKEEILNLAKQIKLTDTLKMLESEGT
ncbi:MAG: hypothetical protein ACPL1Y_07170 [Thermoplasmata archaeon]